jgi:dipeptidyl-peptidase-4
MLACRVFISMLLFVSTVSAQEKTSTPTQLTVDRIFGSDEFRSEPVPFDKWMKSSSYTALLPSKTQNIGRDIVRFDAKGFAEVLVPAEKLIPSGAKEPLNVEAYEFSKDLDMVLIYTNSAKVWRANTRGDYWTFRRSTGKLSKLGGETKPSTMMFAKLSPDGNSVGYVRENSLYVEPAEGGAAVKLTNDGNSNIINGTFDWVYEEEYFCRDGWRWSPDSKQIAYWQLDTSGVKTFTLVDNTAGKYQTMQTFAYPKTGERNSTCRIGVVSVQGGETKWMNIPGDTSTDYYLPRMEWAGNPQELLIRRINRLQNTVDVMLADATSGSVKTILTERDSTWVDIHDDVMKWLDDGKSFTWISERDGWRHLYIVSRDGATQRCVTPGEYDVIKVIHVDEKAGWVYFYASPENPTQHYLYRTSLSGTGKSERLSPADQPGWHDYDISSDGGLAVHTFSSFGKPPRVELITLPDHKVIRSLATNDKLRDVLKQLEQTPAEFLRTDIGNGIKLDGWMIKPPNFNSARKYPLMFHVYGEPWGQTVTDRWGGSQYLWHQMLAQQGYVVACIDNRGTPCPRGRDWRKSVYRKIGTLASDDQSAAARELLKRPYLDAKRVGVWGWSGGGSMTLNLMFRHPDIYRTGMSVAAVPDMCLYDTIYQERYMGLPQENAEDYKQGSPITHAAGLQGNLLIVHGTGDDNCHYQGTEKLVDKLVALNKTFTIMPYPNRSHSISEGANTTRHLYGLLTRYLKTHMTAESKP